MISKQRGIIDPWTLGFLIGLTGLAIVQPWDRKDEKMTKSEIEIETTLISEPQTRHAELFIN